MPSSRDAVAVALALLVFGPSVTRADDRFKFNVVLDGVSWDQIDFQL